jgi:hypothetical protein
MTPEEFERKLQRQTLRHIPDTWRRDILLTAGSAQRRRAAAEPGGRREPAVRTMGGELMSASNVALTDAINTLSSPSPRERESC